MEETTLAFAECLSGRHMSVHVIKIKGSYTAIEPLGKAAQKLLPSPGFA